MYEETLKCFTCTGFAKKNILKIYFLTMNFIVFPELSCDNVAKYNQRPRLNHSQIILIIHTSNYSTAIWKAKKYFFTNEICIQQLMTATISSFLLARATIWSLANYPDSFHFRQLIKWVIPRRFYYMSEAKLHVKEIFSLHCETRY